jgi:hypothetical protein
VFGFRTSVNLACITLISTFREGYLRSSVLVFFSLGSKHYTYKIVFFFSLHYSPGQATLHLDGQQIYANGMNVVFDSGATYTYVPTQIYTPLVAKVKF